MSRKLLSGMRRNLTALRLVPAAARASAFLASYPKSGRTWLRFMLASYLARSLRLGVEVDLHSLFTIVPNFDLSPARGVPAYRFAGRRDVPLVLVTHQPYSRRYLRQPVIFMVRDARDLMVSAYFHATRHKHRFTGELADFMRDPRQGLPAYLAYLNGWAEGLARHRHLLVSYERLSADPAAMLGEVVTFLGLPVDEAAVAAAVERSSFRSMQALERRDGVPEHDYDRSDPESLRARRGKVGGFADYLDPAQAGWIMTATAAGLSPSARSLLVQGGIAL